MRGRYDRIPSAPLYPSRQFLAKLSASRAYVYMFEIVADRVLNRVERAVSRCEQGATSRSSLRMRGLSCFGQFREGIFSWISVKLMAWGILVTVAREIPSDWAISFRLLSFTKWTRMTSMAYPISVPQVPLFLLSMDFVSFEVTRDDDC